MSLKVNKSDVIPGVNPNCAPEIKSLSAKCFNTDNWEKRDWSVVARIISISLRLGNWNNGGNFPFLRYFPSFE